MGYSEGNSIFSGYSGDRGSRGKGLNPLPLFSGVKKYLSAGRIAAIYLLFGVAWTVLINLNTDQNGRVYLYFDPMYLASGITFVLLTACLIYLLVNRYTDESAASIELLSQVFNSSPAGIVVTREKDQRIVVAKTWSCADTQE